MKTMTQTNIKVLFWCKGEAIFWRTNRFGKSEIMPEYYLDELPKQQTTLTEKTNAT